LVILDDGIVCKPIDDDLKQIMNHLDVLLNNNLLLMKDE